MVRDERARVFRVRPLTLIRTPIRLLRFRLWSVLPVPLLFLCLLLVPILLPGCTDSGKSPKPSAPGGDLVLSALVPARTLYPDTVQIVGTGFGPAPDSATVVFAGPGGQGVAAQVTSWTGTSIRVLVPQNATSGEVKVMKNGQTSNGIAFDLAPALRTYVGDMATIFQTHCTVCHTSPAPTGGLDLTTLAGALKGGNDGAVIVPRHSAVSLLWKKVALDNPGIGVRMPQGGPYLASDQIQIIADWIDQGAPQGSAAPPVPLVTVVVPNGGERWAVGSDQTIQYTASEAADPPPTLALEIQYSTDSGSTWTDIASGQPNAGSFAWTVPNVATVHARVRVIASDGQRQGSDESDADFTIFVPSPAPAIASLLPARTVAGDSVRVLGSAFGSAQGGGHVFFTESGGQPREASVLSWADGQIIVTSPAGSDSGTVQVQNAAGSSNTATFHWAPRLIRFQAEILTGLFNNPNYGCTGCHIGGRQGGLEGLDLTSYDSLMVGKSVHGPVVVRRRSSSSLLWEKIALANPPVGVRMPYLGTAVADSIVQNVADWIDQGARNN